MWVGYFCEQKLILEIWENNNIIILILNYKMSRDKLELSFFSEKLEINDSELNEIIECEYTRQKSSIELIASENFTSPGVIQCLGSILTNKYSEGYPNRRYYGGNTHIDQIELLCQKRAIEAFKLDPDKWSVNVQPYSGSPANLAVYTGLLNPNDRIMGLGLTSGGHLTHGFYTNKKKISASSIFFQSFPYGVKDDGWVDYDELEKMALIFIPKIIIAGGSSYPRDFNYERMRDIANKVDAYLMVDMAHFSGFVATKLLNNPFEYADVVTSTTHKTLRGPRSGLIFINKLKESGGLVTKINEAVFPGLQGGPHNHQIAAVAYQLKHVNTHEFKQYMIKVGDMAKLLSDRLKLLGFDIVTDGTDNHIVLVNLKNKELTGSKIEYLCELVDISLNKNCIVGDKNAMSPSGIRIGTSAMVTRGFDSDEFITIANLIKQLVDIAVQIQIKHGKLLNDFKNGCEEAEFKSQLKKIKEEVNNLACGFPFYLLG
jgi:glycine hydroxymethyltransferase